MDFKSGLEHNTYGQKGLDMIKIKPTEAMKIERWKRPVLGVMKAHFPDGMSINDFMDKHPKAPLDIITKVFEQLVQNKEVDHTTTE